MQESSASKTGFGAALSKAGASAMGIESPNAAAGETQYKSLGVGTTQHWKSSYKGTIEASLTQPA